MKSRFIIYSFVLAMVILTALLIIWHHSHISAQPSLMQPTQTIGVLPQKPVTTINVPVQIGSNPTPVLAPQSNTLSTIANGEKTLQITKQFVERRNVPIEFYGKAIDQDSNPLPNVIIAVSVEQLTIPNPLVPEVGSKYIQLKRTTGVDGCFKISGLSGDLFGVRLTKDGFDSEPGQGSFGAGSYDVLNPVLFKMWGTNIHEQLITGNKSFEIVPDGRPYFINLTDGSISERESGDLKIWIQYTNQVVQGQLYDWSARIEVINGGLWEVPQAAMNSGFLDEPPFAMYSAPQDGYISSFSHNGQIKGGQSGEIGNRFFYLLLNGGKEYGRMSINLFAPYGYLHPGLIRLSYAINPSGSRILR